MPKRYPKDIRDKARRLFETGLPASAVADATGVHADTVKGWAKREQWGRDPEAREAGSDHVPRSADRSPLQVQESLEALVSLQLYRLAQTTAPDPTELNRWQDIHAKTRAIIKSIYEQAADPEIFCRVIELMVQHLGSLPRKQQQAVADVLEPFLTSFEQAIRTGNISPVGTPSRA